MPHKADRRQAQLRLDRRVLPPAFTIASPRSGEGEAMAKAGGRVGVPTRKRLESRHNTNRTSRKLPSRRAGLIPRAQAALNQPRLVNGATRRAEGPKKSGDLGCPEQR